jgi:HEAT repeats
VRKQTRIVLAILFVFVLGVLAYEMLRPHELVYHGKSLHVWLEQSIAGGPMAMADTNELAAIRQFGPSIVPKLLEMAQVQDSPLKRDWIKLVRAQKLFRIRLHTDEEYHDMACFGFYALGQVGNDAVPSLIDLLKNHDPNIRATARDCLGNIGPAAKSAVPLIIQFINDTNRIVRWDATVCLGRIHMEPELVVPVLMENLNPTNAILSTTIHVLGEFGEQARPAVPALLQYLNDKDDFVRYETTNALKAIDPAAATKAGVR